MDLRISGTEVFVQLDKGYVAEDDAALLQEVSKFKPLADWITKFRPTDFNLSVIVIRSISKVAQRISSIVFEVTLVSKSSKENLVQTVTLCDEPTQVVLLPILVVDGKKYGALVNSTRVALGSVNVTEAFTGFFQKDGSFESQAATALLDPVGIATSEKYCQSLSEEDISLGDDGFPPVRPMYLEKAISKAEFDNFFGASNKTTNDAGTLVAYPLEEVASNTSDIKAILTASLVLAKSQNETQN